MVGADFLDSNVMSVYSSVMYQVALLMEWTCWLFFSIVWFGMSNLHQKRVKSLGDHVLEILAGK